MGMEQQVNRRRWERYPFDASVRVVVDHALPDQAPLDHSAHRTVVDARGVHFSEGGLCLFAAANLPVGVHVKVEFKNPHTDEPVRVLGKVRNRSVYLYGVEFLSDKFEDRQQLARLSAELRSGSQPSA
ncbi:MAG: PilZ domain-containing protein [Terriglobales bacterium]